MRTSRTGVSAPCKAIFRTLQIDTDNYIPCVPILSRGFTEFFYFFHAVPPHGAGFWGQLCLWVSLQERFRTPNVWAATHIWVNLPLVFSSLLGDDIPPSYRLVFMIDV